jgi:ABC-type Na+ efflux pump permease subunit
VKRARRSGGQNVATAVFLVTPFSALGCAPTLDVLGVYFPAWLVSAVVGLLSAYAVIAWLGYRPGQRELAQSGLFFCSLTVVVSLLNWWIFFRDF